MRWQTPTFEQIDMNAEIGGYQGDDDGGDRGLPPRTGTALSPPDQGSADSHG